MGVQLKDFGLTNHDLDILGSDIPYFKGVFMIDELPSKVMDRECGIVNYQSSKEIGNHWVAYYNHPKFPYACYFDSIGAPPLKSILKYLKTSGKKVVYNERMVQQTDNTCGLFCIAFIKACTLSKDIYQPYYDLFDIHSEESFDRMVKRLILDE